MIPDSKPCLIITGPTASGKTKLAFELAQRLNGYLINADSMQIYNHLSILTARPTQEELSKYASIPYHLDGVLEGKAKASVGWWIKEAAKHIQKAWQTQKLPILVGGTGMYLKALTEGLSPVPDIPEEIKTQVRGLGEKHNIETLQGMIKELDPLTPLFKDKQRLLRAMEVFFATQIPLHQFQQKKTPEISAKFITLTLFPDRNKLYERIHQRFDYMMKEGALDEVKYLKNMHLPKDHPILGATGYRDLCAYLEGTYTLEEAVNMAKQHSRNYAKRQYTWIRRQIHGNLEIQEPPQDVAELQRLFHTISSLLD